jgi:steroid delta-isomerase-like uncharacterized protein
MPQQNLIEIARELIDAFNAGDGPRFKKQITADSVYDEVGTQRRMTGAEAWVQTWEQWKISLPDLKGTVTNALVSGDTVVLEVTWEGTHTRALEMPGNSIPASGRRIVTRGSMVLTFEGGRVKESRHYFDMLSLLQLTGAMNQQLRASGR